MKYRSETSDGVLSVERDDELESARDELETERCRPRLARCLLKLFARGPPATVNITATRNRAAPHAVRVVGTPRPPPGIVVTHVGTAVTNCRRALRLVPSSKPSLSPASIVRLFVLGRKALLPPSPW